MKFRVFFAFIMMVCAISFMSSCEDEHYNMIMDLGGGGNYTIVNMGTNDTLKIEEGLYFNSGKNPTLVAHIGNVIKIKFTPKEEYKKYSFNIKYTLPNGKVVEDKPEYEYVIGDTLTGKYDIYLSAISFGKTEHDTWNISANGVFTLKVVQ